MQNALKDIFGPMFEAMLQGEMNSHLGYKATITEQNQQTTAVTATLTKRLRQAPVKLTSRCLVTEIPALNLSLCQSFRRVYRK